MFLRHYLYVQNSLLDIRNDTRDGTLLVADLPNLFAGALQTDIYFCPNCRKLEFYAADETVAGEELPKKTCPTCGTVHDFDYPKCPNCGHSY